MWKNTKRTMAGLALVITCLVVLPGQTQATPPGGVVGTPLVRGSFTDDVGVKFKLSVGDRTIVADAKDASQVAFQNFTFAPGGTTGWHSHPGPVVVLVKSGALTYYQGFGFVCGPGVPRRHGVPGLGRRPRAHRQQRKRRHDGDLRRVLRRTGRNFTPDRRACAGQLQLLTT